MIGYKNIGTGEIEALTISKAIIINNKKIGINQILLVFEINCRIFLILVNMVIYWLNLYSIPPPNTNQTGCDL
jgi:hypothetical protein